MTDNIVLAKIINDLHFIDRSGLTEGKCNLREKKNQNQIIPKNPVVLTRRKFLEEQFFCNVPPQ